MTWPSRPSLSGTATRARRRALPRTCLRLGLSALLLALAASVLVALSGHSPVAAVRALVAGAFGSTRAIGAGLDRSTPYMLGGVGVALCFRARVINIGAEGQIAAGGLGATVAALAWPQASPVLAVAAALMGGASAGALWSGLAAALHLVRGVHEVLATLLLNFIALLLVQLLLAGPLGEAGAGFLQSPPISQAARLPLLSGIEAHAGFLLALLAAASCSAVLWRTRFGFGLRVLGASRAAARYGGFSETGLVAAVMVLAGALAGLGGAVEVLGLHRRLVEGFSLGFGYQAVTVALLGLLEPLAVIPAALFVGFLQTGAQSMQRQVGVPSALVIVLEGLTVMAVLAATSRSGRI